MGNCTEIFHKKKPINGNRVCPTCNQAIHTDFGQHQIQCIRNRNLILQMNQVALAHHIPRNNNNIIIPSVSNNNDSIQQEGINQYPNPSVINNNPNMIRPINIININNPHHHHQPTSQQHQSRALRQNFVWTRVFDEKDKTKHVWKQVEVGLIIEQDLIKQLSHQDIKDFSFEEKQVNGQFSFPNAKKSNSSGMKKIKFFKQKKKQGNEIDFQYSQAQLYLEDYNQLKSNNIPPCNYIYQRMINQRSNKSMLIQYLQMQQIWFRYKLEQLRIPWTEGADWMAIQTDNVLHTSLTAIEQVNLHKEVKISINGDKVQDAGGLLREWIHMITKEIFDKNTGLFQLADSEEITYKINQDADKSDHIKNCFILFGKVIGKAIFERIPLEAYIDKTIIKQLISQKVTLDDIFSYDQQLYKSWLYIKNNKLKEDDYIGFMSYSKKTPNGILEVDLIDKGQDIEITEENKLQFIDLSIQYVSYKLVKDFIEYIQTGLYSVIPKNLLEIFDVNEIEMILNGVPFINVDDWEQNSVYKNGYSKTHNLIVEFWKQLRALDQPKLEKFLHFCTGSSRTSVEGFKKLESNRGNYAKFCIELVKYDQNNPYPKAHTCFNRLELPLYPTKELLSKYLQIIVNTDLDGIFGMEQTVCLNFIKG